jgi:transmembrane sensor
MLSPSRKNEFIDLLKRYQQEKASPKEIQFLKQYYRYFDKEEKASLGMSQADLEWLENKLFRDIERILELETQTLPTRTVRIFTFPRVAAAAILILLLGATAYEWRNEITQREMAKIPDTSQRFKNDIAPGTQKAILTLASGTTIILDSMHDGTIAQQGKAKLLNFNRGVLSYQAIDPVKAKTETTETFYNTVRTPRGGQYQLLLADGTKVWLNAASSLRFPASFNGKIREVELTGEAYFEVAKNSGIPFKVHIGFNGVPDANRGMDVLVTGTHFNINAYDNEASVKTTLLEGSVKVIRGDEYHLLQPGNQSQVEPEGKMKLVASANVDEAVAWKNGMFNFKSADIETIMRQISRWYDVDITYQQKVDERFYAEISRNTNVSNVFKMLELTGGVHFSIEGKKVIVAP